jgi:hypothetical protein
LPTGKYELGGKNNLKTPKINPDGVAFADIVCLLSKEFTMLVGIVVPVPLLR